MSFQRRLTVLVTIAVGIAVAVAAVAMYVVMRNQLRDQVDEDLTEVVQFVQSNSVRDDPSEADGDIDTPPGDGAQAGGGQLEPPASPDDSGRALIVRVIAPDGELLRETTDLTAPFPSDQQIAEARAGELVVGDVGTDERVLRVMLATDVDGNVVQIARSLKPVRTVLAEIRVALVAIMILGIAVAALFAAIISRRTLAPIIDLTSAVEHVSRTEDLSQRIEVRGDDELALLAERFNQMMDRLERSRDQLDESHIEQRNLIEDASHGLRTPVTGLRTNLEVLASTSVDGIAPDERRRIFDDAVAQADELGALITDVIDLARGEARDDVSEPIRLDAVAEESVERARRHAPQIEFQIETSPCVIDGSPERIARALNNLLDNAAGHAGSKPVEVTVSSGVFRVRDHGPGLAEGDQERVFNRFYRGPGANARPGSGLGLAIVRQVAETHGGSAVAVTAEGGGAVFELRLPLGDEGRTTDADQD